MSSFPLVHAAHPPTQVNLSYMESASSNAVYFYCSMVAQISPRRMVCDFSPFPNEISRASFFETPSSLQAIDHLHLYVYVLDVKSL